MKEHPIPQKCLSSHMGVLGKAGSGKTYTAKGIVEKLLQEGKRVCIVDPTSVWYGLRSDATSKKAGFPIVVFGGKHQDVPLGPTHGAAIAEIVGTTDTPAILDTRLMSVGDRTRFFTDFAETLLEKNDGPLHLIIDEAHLFAPQGRVADPQSGKMLHATNNLISLGRASGLRVILISQRPAKVHKDSLTQIETLVCLRLIAPQDRRAVEDWIGEWAEPKQGAELMASLPSLPTGEGWVWSPEMGVLKRVTFPRIKTYDSSKAPDGVQGKIVLASIDLPAIQARLETVAKVAIENDPKRLKARIAELEKAKGKPDEGAIKEAEHEGYQRGFSAGRAAAVASCADKLQALVRDLGKPSPPPLMAMKPDLVAAAKRHASESAVKKADVGEGITNPQQRILDAMATLKTLGLAELHKVQIAAIAGVSPGSGSFANNLGRLRTAGLIDYPQPGQIAFTAEGEKRANFPSTPPSLDDLHEAWLELITGPQSRILRELLECYPKAMSKSDLAVLIDVSPGSGSYANNLGRLRTLGVIDYPSKGFVRADDLLFP